MLNSYYTNVKKELTKGVDCVIRILPEGISIRDFIDVNEDMIEDVDYAELETCCPYPVRDRCEGCPRYIEDEGICDLEIG